MLQLPQSTVSRHLKTLADAGWVDVARATGTSRYYTLSLDDRVHARRLWSLLREQVSVDGRRRAGRSVGSKRARASGNRSRRNSSSRTAGQWDKLRAELFGAGVVPCRRCRRCSTTDGSWATWVRHRPGGERARARLSAA